MISAKLNFKGYSEEHRVIKLDVFISLPGGKTISRRFSIGWTKTFEGNKIPQKKQGCLVCDNKPSFSNCVTEPKMNCFNCEVETACETCLDQNGQTKTYSTFINMLKRKHANEYRHILPFYIIEYLRKQNKN